MVTFGQVVENHNVTVNPSPGERLVGLEHLDSASLHVSRWGVTSDDSTFTRAFTSGQVLFGKRRAYQRKAAVVDFDGVCSGDILVFDVRLGRGLVRALLPYLAQTDAFVSHAVRTSAGSLSPRTKWSELAKFSFRLASRASQERALAVLAAADDSIQKLEKVRKALEDVRLSMGNEWLDTDGVPSWTVADLVETAALASPQDGNHGDLHPKAADFSDEGIPFLTASDVRGQRVALDKAKRLPRELADGLRIGFSHAGDILLTHKGTVGEVAVLPELDTAYAMLSPQVTYYRVLDVDQLDRDYLYYCLLSPSFQRQLHRSSQQSTRAYVGITAQRELRLPKCDLVGQRSLAARFREVEMAASCARAEEERTRSLQRAIAERFFRDGSIH